MLTDHHAKLLGMRMRPIDWLALAVEIAVIAGLVGAGLAGVA